MFKFVCCNVCYDYPSYEVERDSEYQSQVGYIGPSYERNSFEFTQYDDADSLSVAEMREIADFMEERWKTKFRVGDNVTVNAECSMEYLRGLKGTITSINSFGVSIHFKLHGAFTLYEKSIEYNG